MGRLIGIATRTATKIPMRERDDAAVTLERGVADDLRGKPGKRQVTVLGREAWERACAQVGSELAWTLRRANLFVEGLELEQSAGRRLQIGTAVLAVTCETDPCFVMDKQHPGLRAALTPNWRGGASCRVEASGHIRVGDEARWLEEGTMA
jgi:MOSC domain-containing protein YiiM